MARAYAAIANGGVLVQPHLVDRIDGKPYEQKRGERIVSQGRLDADALHASRRRDRGHRHRGGDPGLHGGREDRNGREDRPDGRYSHTRYVASFVGLVPATKPRLVIMVMVDEPSGSIYGGEVAAPAFKQIARFNLQHLEVPPDAPRSGASRRTEPSSSLSRTWNSRP